jgi:hypothetical protein
MLSKKSLICFDWTQQWSIVEIVILLAPLLLIVSHNFYLL